MRTPTSKDRAQIATTDTSTDPKALRPSDPGANPTPPPSTSNPESYASSVRFSYYPGRNEGDHIWDLRSPANVFKTNNFSVVAVFRVNKKITKTDVLFSSNNLHEIKDDDAITISIKMLDKVALINEKSTVSTFIELKDSYKTRTFKRNILISNEPNLKIQAINKANLEVIPKNRLFAFTNDKGNVGLVVETRFVN